MFKNTVAVGVMACLGAVGSPGQGIDYSLPGAATFLEPKGQPAIGEIRNIHGSASDLVVVLSGMSDGRAMHQVPVDGSGTFELGRIAPGTYIVRVIHPPNDVLVEEVTQVGTGQSVILQLPEKPQEAKASTISSDQLQHPLSAKGAKMIRKAQDYAQAGDHGKAIEELKHALAEPTAAPYAHGILGTEYLKTGQVASAQTELETAIQMLPHDASLHSNLGYALFVKGDRDRGEREVRKALDLDRSNAAAQRLLGYILKGEPRAQ